MPSTPGPVPRSFKIARSRARQPWLPSAKSITPEPLNPAAGWMTVPAGPVEVPPFTPPLTPASSLPLPGVSGRSVNQWPRPSWTLMSSSPGLNALLIAARSVAPLVLPEGKSWTIAGMRP